MSAGAFPKPSLRPYQQSDLETLAGIRFAAIEELTIDHYGRSARPRRRSQMTTRPLCKRLKKA
jgi:hypothetical protein